MSHEGAEYRDPGLWRGIPDRRIVKLQGNKSKYLLINDGKMPWIDCGSLLKN